MPRTSDKGNRMPPSPIRKLVPYAEAAKKRGIKIYHLNIGQPDIETPQVMFDAVRNYPKRVVEYSHSAGNESYRKKLTEYYRRYNINLDYTEIIVTTGGSEGIEQNVVLLDSISKRYSACGARIGALISKNKEVMSAALKFAQARLSPPAFGQVAAEAAVDAPEEYFSKVKTEYVARRDFIVNALNSIEGVFCPKPSGAFYCIARLPVDDADIFCQWLLEKFSYDSQTVMLAPASGFYSTKGAGKDEVRIAYVLNINDLRKAMECLALGLLQYPGRTLKREKEKQAAE